MPSPAWTPQEIENLKTFWATKTKSASEIAFRLGSGRSRCSVLGKINRLGLSEKKPPAAPKVFRYKTTQGPSLPTLSSQPLRRSKPILRLVAPKSLHLSVLELSDKTCRWPIGDVGHTNFHFCGQSPRDGSPYCEFHAIKSVQPLHKATTGERKAHTWKHAG